MNTLVHRSGAIDAVRVLGIAAVVAGHTWGLPLTRPLIYSWHVPLFFILAGYFWSDRRTLKEALPRRAWTLAAPYFTWFVIISAVYIPAAAVLNGSSISHLLKPFVTGWHWPLPFTTFWFVSTLFATVVLMRILQILPPLIVWAIAIGGSVAGALAGPALAHTPLWIGSALACLIFVILGRVAKWIRPHITRPGLVGLALLVVCATLIAVGVSAPVDIKQGDFGTPGLSVLVAAAIAFALILLAEKIFNHLPDVVHRGVTVLSFAGFAVILLHPLLWWLMLKFAPDADHWLIFAVTITASWCVGVIALWSPASRWLTGVARGLAPRPAFLSRDDDAETDSGDDAGHGAETDTETDAGRMGQ